MIAFGAAAYLVFVGFILGSFINLAADRLPRGESLVKPRSHCRGCNRELNVVDLLPVLGYIARGGRCASCKASIGIGAPAVEVVSGAAMALAVVWLGVWPGAAVGLSLVCLWGLLVTVRARREFQPDTASDSLRRGR